MSGEVLEATALSLEFMTMLALKLPPAVSVAGLSVSDRKVL